MLWGIFSNHTMPSSTYKLVSFDPALQIPMDAQHTVPLVTCHGGMSSSHPSYEWSILDLQQGKCNHPSHIYPISPD